MDGTDTQLFYVADHLARVVEPGTKITDYGYDGAGRLSAVRDDLANDAVLAGVRTVSDPTTATTIAYDSASRVTSVTDPYVNATDLGAPAAQLQLPGWHDQDHHRWLRRGQDRLLRRLQR